MRPKDIGLSPLRIGFGSKLRLFIENHCLSANGPSSKNFSFLKKHAFGPTQSVWPFGRFSMHGGRFLGSLQADIISL